MKAIALSLALTSRNGYELISAICSSDACGGREERCTHEAELRKSTAFMDVMQKTLRCAVVISVGDLDEVIAILVIKRGYGPR